mmetsp:Transcript_22709/g.49742  ORF Transcript_22709/g.49742 Transcript_22709/m.49742 type:complete len:173 (-) Transcript_22709:216-734(-)
MKGSMSTAFAFVEEVDNKAWEAWHEVSCDSLSAGSTVKATMRLPGDAVVGLSEHQWLPEGMEGIQKCAVRFTSSTADQDMSWAVPLVAYDCGNQQPVGTKIVDMGKIDLDITVTESGYVECWVADQMLYFGRASVDVPMYVHMWVWPRDEVVVQWTTGDDVEDGADPPSAKL